MLACKTRERTRRIVWCALCLLCSISFDAYESALQSGGVTVAQKRVTPHREIAVRKHHQLRRHADYTVPYGEDRAELSEPSDDGG